MVTPKSYPHLAVIRLSAMGDVAMAVPVIRMLRQHYPDLRLTIVTRKFFAPLFAGIPNLAVFEAKVETHHKGIGGLWRLAQELQATNITGVVDLHGVIRSKIISNLLRLYRIPMCNIDKGRAEKRALTRSRNKVFCPLRTTHARYEAVFEHLGYPMDRSIPYVYPPRPALTPKIQSLTGRSPRKWLGIAPFAQHSGKTYPLTLMHEVIAKIHAQDHCKMFLFGGGKNECVQLQEIADQYDAVVNVAGKLLFEEELILIANLDVMLSMDSGNGHLSAMYGIPTITLWGVTHPYAGFAPFRQPIEHSMLPDLTKFPLVPTSVYGATYPDGYESVMETIRPQTVIDKVTQVLAHS